jgi:hypothetical protein
MSDAEKIRGRKEAADLMTTLSELTIIRFPFRA